LKNHETPQTKETREIGIEQEGEKQRDNIFSFMTFDTNTVNYKIVGEY
jgi:hypothetical protein